MPPAESIDRHCASSRAADKSRHDTSARQRGILNHRASVVRGGQAEPATIGPVHPMEFSHFVDPDCPLPDGITLLQAHRGHSVCRVSTVKDLRCLPYQTPC